MNVLLLLFCQTTIFPANEHARIERAAAQAPAVTEADYRAQVEYLNDRVTKKDAAAAATAARKHLARLPATRKRFVEERYAAEVKKFREQLLRRGARPHVVEHQEASLLKSIIEAR